MMGSLPLMVTLKGSNKALTEPTQSYCIEEGLVGGGGRGGREGGREGGRGDGWREAGREGGREGG